jgi:hypothetical protein
MPDVVFSMTNACWRAFKIADVMFVERLGPEVNHGNHLFAEDAR